MQIFDQYDWLENQFELAWAVFLESEKYASKYSCDRGENKET